MQTPRPNLWWKARLEGAQQATNDISGSSNNNPSILDHVLRFIDLTKRYQHNKSCEETKLVVNTLLAFLETAEVGGNNLVSSDDVAALLLTWATKQLVFVQASSSNEETEVERIRMYWKVMSMSCYRLLSNDENKTFLTQTLNQSVLNKLVIFAAQQSCHGKDDYYSTKSFVFMTDNLFRPTMDLAAKSLVVQLSKLEALPERIITSIFTLLKLLQRNANPKSTFVLFSECSVLEAMAKLFNVDQQKDLISEIFFHSTHHMDGFRSILTTSSEANTGKSVTSNRSFRCYQEAFMKALQHMIDSNQRNVIQMMPLLLQGFIHQTQAWNLDHQRKSSKKKSNTISETASLQFKFWTQLAGPLLKKLLEAENDALDCKLVLARAIRETLELVLLHDLYLPSFEDKEKRHFLFLEEMATRLMFECSGKGAVATESLRVLEMLLKLNHHVVHERLSQFISYMLTSGAEDLSNSISPVVMSTIVETYHQLRQLDFFFGAVVATVADSGAPMATLNFVLQHPSVVEKLSLSIAACPQGQLQQLFQKLDSWIIETMNREVEPDCGKVTVVANLFVVLLRHVSVDQHVASATSDICISALTGSVKSLLESEYVSATRRHGLELCGWTLDLKTRCTFWLGDEDDSPSRDDSFLRLLHALTNQAATNGNLIDNEASGAIIDELQFLACYRIQQLHSLIHKCNQNAPMKITKEYQGTASFEEEAMGLVNYIFVSLSKIKDSTKNLAQRGWILLSKFIHLWIHYSRPSHMETFVAWILSTIAVDKDTLENDVLKDCVCVSKMVVAALFSDASFIEVEQVATLIGRIGINHVVLLFCAILGTDPTATSELKVPINDVSLSFLVKHSSWKSVSTDSLNAVLLGTHHSSFPCDSTRYAYERVLAAEKALRLLKFLNGVNGRLAHSNDLATLFESLLRLHTLSCSIVLEMSSSQNTTTKEILKPIVGILGYCRGLASRLLNENQGQNQIKFENISILLDGVIYSHLNILTLNTAYNDIKEFQEKTIGFLECATAALTRYYGNAGISVIFDVVESASSKLNDNSFLHPILSSLLNLDPEANELIRNGFGRIVMGFQGEVIRAHVQATSEYDQFLTNILRLAAIDRDRNFREIEKCVQLAAEDASRIRSTEERARLVASLVVAGSGNNLIEICEQLYMESNEQHHNFGLIDAIFGTLIRQEGDDDCGEISDLLERLESLSPTQTWIASHMFCIIIKNVDDEKLRESTLAKYARQYYIRGLDLLCRPRSLQNLKQLEHLNQGEALIIELTKHKDIIVIRERDLALLLAQICLLLGPISASSDPLSSHFYATVYNILSTVLQRFAKQLYTCAPALISSLRLLLRHTLHGPDDSIESRSQMLSRLCEFLLPHQDVFKKHILVLLLEYISLLKGEKMSPFRKRALMPAIFSLLETQSLFEHQQLNSMTDTTGKVLFASVFSSYQQGKYKGQF